MEVSPHPYLITVINKNYFQTASNLLERMLLPSTDQIKPSISK